MIASKSHKSPLPSPNFGGLQNTKTWLIIETFYLPHDDQHIKFTLYTNFYVIWTNLNFWRLLADCQFFWRIAKNWLLIEEPCLPNGDQHNHFI